MSDYCSFCETRRPDGGTNHLVLNGGELWLEFCEKCGKEETLTNPETDETITVKALFDKNLHPAVGLIGSLCNNKEVGA